MAIAIPEPYGGELQGYRDRFGDPLARAIPTHITLLPPTPVRDRDLHDIEDHLQAVASSERPFDIVLRGTDSFRPLSPVVFVALAVGAADCTRVESAVRSGPLHRDLRFPYHPHVTVAHDLPDDVLDEAGRQLAEYDASFLVWGFSLYEHGIDGVWRPMRDYTFGRVLPGPLPERAGTRWVLDPAGRREAAARVDSAY